MTSSVLLSANRIVSSADIVLSVLSSDTSRIQEGHITIGHIICDIAENFLATMNRR